MSFLRDVIRHLPLPGAIAIEARAEDIAGDPMFAGQQDVITCRALRMDVFLKVAKPFVRPNGLLIAMQGPKTDRSAAARLAEDHRLRLVDVLDYRLPDGAPRRLLVCAS